MLATLLLGWQAVKPLGPTVHFQVGFLLVLALYLLLVILHAVLALQRRRSRRAPPAFEEQVLSEP